MVTISPVYGSVVNHACDVSALAADTNLLAGREGTAIDQKDTEDAVDALFGGNVDHDGTNGYIQVYLYSSYDDTTFTAGCTGADSNRAIASQEEKAQMAFVLKTIGAVGTDHKFGPVSLRQIFGYVPVQWGVWVVWANSNADATALTASFSHFPVKISW